ncbi:MAG TPA: hypothetical protein VK021_04080 [Flavobacteriaceae bacterium]|nr:hypothetical protein [Flavobacteriaceae bacterium]
MKVLHQSKYYTFYQCDLKRCFRFETEHKSVQLSFCQLLALRNQVQGLNLEAHFYDDQNKNGLEILCFCNREHILLLDTYQAIDLKNFMTDVFEQLQGQCVSKTLV